MNKALVMEKGGGEERRDAGVVSAPQLQLLPGFRFHPTDEELLVHYLSRKADSRPFAIPIIAEVDLYKYDPWDLPNKALFGEREWYFFSPRDRKYPNGARPNRAAGSGYWKATGTDKPIFSSMATGYPQKVGVKKALVFYAGKAPRGVKTNWIMHEYRLIDSRGNPLHARRKGSQRLDDWVLCRIYNRCVGAQKPKPAGADEDSSFDDHDYDDLHDQALSLDSDFQQQRQEQQQKSDKDDTKIIFPPPTPNNNSNYHLLETFLCEDMTVDSAVKNNNKVDRNGAGVSQAAISTIQHFHNSSMAGNLQMARQECGGCFSSANLAGPQLFDFSKTFSDSCRSDPITINRGAQVVDHQPSLIRHNSRQISSILQKPDQLMQSPRIVRQKLGSFNQSEDDELRSACGSPNNALRTLSMIRQQRISLPSQGSISRDFHPFPSLNSSAAPAAENPMLIHPYSTMPGAKIESVDSLYGSMDDLFSP